MKISLIIPVYNVEKYLDKCLKSVENQSFRSAEVIIVNDGSPDESYKIIDKYVTRNSNFVTYKIENSGLGGARNFGLTKATGDYVVFLDSDDYIAENCLERFAKTAEENDSDIVVCNSYDVDEKGNILSQTLNNKSNVTVSLTDSPDILLNRPCAWAKMYRRSLFDNLSYVSREWYEDLRLTPKLFLKANRITYIDDSLFFYVQRDGSIMNNSKAERNLEIINAFNDVIGYFKEQNAYEHFKQEFDYLVIEHIAIAAITRVALCDSPEKKRVIKALDNYVTSFEKLWNNKYISTLTSNKKLILAFNRRKMYLLTTLCMKIKNKIR